jgi:hypothetical protein
MLSEDVVPAARVSRMVPVVSNRRPIEGRGKVYATGTLGSQLIARIELAGTHERDAGDGLELVYHSVSALGSSTGTCTGMSMMLAVIARMTSSSVY